MDIPEVQVLPALSRKIGEGVITIRGKIRGVKPYVEVSVFYVNANNLNGVLFAYDVGAGVRFITKQHHAKYLAVWQPYHDMLQIARGC